VVLAVVLAAGVTYVMLRSESSVATPPIVTADATPANKVVPADNAPADDKTKPAVPDAGKVAAAQPGLDDAAPLGDHPVASPALASDARGRVSPGKPPTGASPAVPQSAAAPADGAADATPEVPPRPTQVDSAVESTPDSRAAPSSGAFVQVSSQKSERAAKSTYRGLQAKFPAIFGKLDPNIQRADFDGKGVYYRVRVGPLALADAKRICGSYKAAGGDCLIAQH
jgi:hypothetical protein